MQRSLIAKIQGLNAPINLRLPVNVGHRHNESQRNLPVANSLHSTNMVQNSIGIIHTERASLKHVPMPTLESEQQIQTINSL